MKGLKTYLLILLALCLVIALAACGGDQNGTDESSGDGTESGSLTEGNATSESGSATDSGSEEESQSAESEPATTYETMPNGDPVKDPWIDDAGDEIWTMASA